MFKGLYFILLSVFSVQSFLCQASELDVNKGPDKQATLDFIVEKLSVCQDVMEQIPLHVTIKENLISIEYQNDFNVFSLNEKRKGYNVGPENHGTSTFQIYFANGEVDSINYKDYHYKPITQDRFYCFINFKYGKQLQKAFEYLDSMSSKEKNNQNTNSYFKE